MMIELINTGTELMLGRVLNSHQQWICRRMADLGYVVQRQVAVPDTAQAIGQAVREALSRADLVITTGGLGPTSDDLTRDVIARLLGVPLRERPEIVAHVRDYFASRNRPMPDRTRVEAMVPEGARFFLNRTGTAPGLAMQLNPNPFRPDGKTSWLIMLPGPRRELQPMFTDSLVPLLHETLPLQQPFQSLTLRTAGIGESLLEQRIAPQLDSLVHRGLELGYCARPWQVDVRLSASGPDAASLIAQGETVVRNELKDNIFGTSDEEMEAVVVRILRNTRKSLALAESCTGGGIANKITNVPGASDVFKLGLVTYSNETKQSVLNVNAETIERHGAVSEEVAREMALGAKTAAKSDFAIAVTGIAGPSGGSPQKPVGTVCIAVASATQTTARTLLNPWDRLTFKEVTSLQALDILRQQLLSVF
ncbi:MAG: competence/damage-inducible protein A [Verrucomicrobiota bacterium]